MTPILSGVSAATSVPLQTYDVTGISMGPAVLLVGVLSMLLAASVALKNPAAVIAWGFTVLMFVFSGIFNLGFEFVWLSVIVTAVLVCVGAVVRWSA